MPSVSIIMPAYNARPYVERSVRSILDQTFRDFEFIVIDDGSTDGTGDLLRAIGQGDPRLRVVSRANTGLTRALREAMSLATAPLIARMDADDIALPHRLQLQVDRFAAEPDLVLLGGGYEFIDEVDLPIRPFIPPTEHEALDAAAFAGGNPFCHPLVMFRRAAYDKTNGYDPAMEPAEDLDLWLRLAEIGRVSAVPQVLLQYRQHAKSVSERRQAAQLAAIRAACAAAAARRGLAAPTIEPVAWRSTGTRASDVEQLLRFGWWALRFNHPTSARRFAARALRMQPLKKEAWALLVASMRTREKKADSATQTLTERAAPTT